MDPFEKPWSGVETAGRMCLSLVNTLDWRLRASPDELLTAPGEVFRWARTAGVLSPSEARHLRADADAHPRRAARVLGETIEFRESLASVFLAICLQEPVPVRALGRLDGACADAGAAHGLRSVGSTVTWSWRRSQPEPRRPLWAVALDAFDLLTSGAVERVCMCGDAECGWLFLDTSKNRSRRWCTMQSCGNRNKARSFYRRSRGGS